LNLELFFVKLSFVQNFNEQPVENFSEKQSLEILADENPTPDNPPWNSWAAFGVWLASVVFLIVLGNLFLLPYLLKQNLEFTNQQALIEFTKSDPTAVLLQLAATIPAHLLTLLLAWMVVTRFNKFSFRQTLGWGKGGFMWWHYPLILIGIFAVSAIVSYFVPEHDNDMMRMLRSSRAAVFIVAFLATFTAPLVEEVIYRGILYSAFQRTFGVAPAVFIVTLIFAAVHFYQYWGSPATIFLICFLSLILTLVRVRAKSLLPCIILHTAINGIQSVYLILEPYLGVDNAAQQQAALFNLLK